MKALLLSQYNQLDLVDLPIPQPLPDEVLIRVQACGICGSDVHGYDGSTGRRVPPIVMGHEAAGIVEDIGSAVIDFRPGERVTFDSTISCGKCFFCLRGQANLCDRREVLGVATSIFRRMGAFAEYVAVPARIVYRLPAEMPFPHAALIEAVSVAVHAVSLTPIHLGDTVVVIGAGMIGLLTMQAARLAGASQIIVMDVDQTRLTLATKLGADHTSLSMDREVPKAVLEITEGRGADVTFECVGASPTIGVAVESVRKGGSVTLVGNVVPTVDLPLQSVVTRQIRLQGSCASSGEYPTCISLMAQDAILVEPLISAVAPLSEGAGWFSRLYNREPGLLKVVLQP